MNHPNQQAPQTQEEYDREFRHQERWHLINEILKLFAHKTGEYAVCRKDGQPLSLADIMQIGDIFEKAEKCLTR